MSARLVAATTMMLSDWVKPSISTSSWLSVCSRSSWLSELPPRLRPDGVELVDEDDARRVAARFLEQLADARCADAGVHLDEVGTARRDERHARFSRHRARQQRLAGARRPDEQDAARNPAANGGEPRRVLQEVDDFLNLVLGLVHARDVLERDGHGLGIDRARLLERRHTTGDHAEQRQPGEAEEDQAQRQRAEAADARWLHAVDVNADAAIGERRRRRSDSPRNIPAARCSRTVCRRAVQRSACRRR